MPGTGGKTMHSSIQPSCLYVVATPIGHLDDCSPRAKAVMGSVDFICAEDTRTARQLLALLGIAGPKHGLVPLHAHNEAEASESVVARLASGLSAALVCDAGTPAISDPGARLVALAHREGIRVVPVPGPSSLTALVSVSGLQTGPQGGIRFVGFAPSKAKSRDDWLKGLSASEDITVFFEAPHRMPDMAQALLARLDEDRPMAMGRELTKQFETVISGTVRSVLAQWKEHQTADAAAGKGEYVLALGPSLPSQATPNDDWLAAQHSMTGQAWATLVAEALPPSAGAKLLSRALGCDRDSAYAALLRATK